MQRILYIASAPPDLSHGGSHRTRAVCRALNRCAPTDLLLVGVDPVQLGARKEQLREDYGLIACAPRTPNITLAFGLPPSRILNRLLIPFVREFRFNAIAYKKDPRVAQVVDRVLAERHYDKIIIHQLSTACRAGQIGRAGVVVDVDDYEIEQIETEISTLSCWNLRRMTLAHRLRSQALLWDKLLGQIEDLWISNRELSSLPQFSEAEWVPNPAGNAIHAQGGEPQPQQKILFVGSLGRAQAEHGLEHFLAHVWPTVLKAQPDARLVVCGGGASKPLQKRLSETASIDFQGFVDDLKPFYDEAAAFICPVYFGSGTNIKIIEALGMECPVVTTPFGLRGYESLFELGQHIFVGETDQTYADALIGLLESPTQSRGQAKGAAALVQKYFSLEEIQAKVAAYFSH